ncbi:hypothetical protein LTR62_000622 [Meristemomyces frigidus]|uniref:NDT80 domain-containing protein n=1 Tax=Meristemomyces frigidus TaxID=1508187 RepID=A0AAN7YCB2_9PEZI|nr:hypothetical protein LTR62_000622 [Meristemomyces frigidus]
MEGLPGFDTSTMTWTQMVQPAIGSGSDPYQEMLLPMEMPDHRSTYGYAGSEDLNLRTLQPQVTPQLRHFSSNFEDPFSDVVSTFEPANQDPKDNDNSSIEHDNKLLGFSLPVFTYTLLDYMYRPITASLTAQLHGMFFLAESPWAAAGDGPVQPNELTCYRRNLFQITGEITLPRTLRYLMTEQGEQIPIMGQELMICATESTEGNPVKIISVPWKTPSNSNVQLAEDKAEREPPFIPLDLLSGQEIDTDLANFPFQWKRLQFRIATANNGRRKELQQHFIVHLRIVAVLANGSKVPICEVHSGAIIVRGRSPRNFQARKDMPVSGAGHARKTSNMTAQLTRTNTGESGKKAMLDNPTSAPLKQELPQAIPQMTAFFDEPVINATFNDWGGSTQTHDGPRNMLLPGTAAFEEGNIHAIPSPDLARPRRTPAAPTAPINLSLVEDDSVAPGASTSPPNQRSAKKAHIPPRPPSFSLNTVNSPDESADLLYEYFPLGLDDWMPPVDAVYRPHVVHHTKLPTDPRDPKTSGKGARNKRYFSEDVS